MSISIEDRNVKPEDTANKLEAHPQNARMAHYNETENCRYL